MSSWELVVLGVAQDGGLPHLGCHCPRCDDARAGRRPREHVACVGLRGPGGAHLFDATPDLPRQLDRLTGGDPPAGVWLTHAHVGHYPGLIHFGPEIASSRGLPVYATAPMVEVLRANLPWSILFDEGHLSPRVLTPDTPVDLGGLTVTPWQVPHRDEHADTVGFHLAGPNASAVFIPDIDDWDAWDRDLSAVADEVDVLLVDGSFAWMDELPGREISDIPHPLTSDTRARVAGRRAQLKLIHLNHSNPDWDADDRAVEGEVIAL